MALVLAAPLWGLSITTRDWPAVTKDWAVRTLLVVSAALMVTTSWAVSVILLLQLIHWRSSRDTTGVVLNLQGPITWGCIAGVLALGSSVPVTWHAWVTQAFVWSALGQVLWMMGSAIVYRKMPLLDLRLNMRGTTGNAVITAALLAMAIPFASPWQQIIIGAGLLATGSFVGILAACAALTIASPAIGWWLVGMAGVAAGAIRMRTGYRDFFIACRRIVCEHTWNTPFDDSVRERRLVLGLLIRTWLSWPTWYGLVGKGHQAFSTEARWWLTQRKVFQLFKQAHNDWLQLLLEYGLVGFLAVTIWMAMLLYSQGTLGDPLTAAVAAGIIASMGQFPLHLPQSGIPWIILVGLLVAR